jgi:membrane fusion protein (multidrug efflux system)
VTVTLRIGEPRSVLVVPQAAIQEDQSGKFVLTVDETNTVAVAPITVGSQDGTDWIVTGGLNEGDTIVVQGIQRIRPGMQVAPSRAAEGAAEG